MIEEKAGAVSVNCRNSDVTLSALSLFSRRFASQIRHIKCSYFHIGNLFSVNCCS